MIAPKPVFVAAFYLFTLCCCKVGMAQVIYEFDHSVEVIVDDQKLTQPWAGGMNSGQYHAVDLNRDGKADLAVFDRSSIHVNTFIWTEEEGYVYDPDYEALFPDDLNAWMHIVDFNCDGIEDLISSSVFGMKAYVGSLRNNALEWTLLIDPISTEGFSSQVNLQVNSADIPAITDIDGDGDLDIFVFNFARGGTIEYHQNLSMDNTGECGLLFKRVNSIWGDFEECTCGVYALGVSCSEMTGRRTAAPEKVLHAGGKSLLLLDYDGDGDKDMLFGDEECDNLAYFVNTEVNGVADFNEYIVQFPEDSPTTLPFPAAFLLDTDHDGLQDLIVAPNLSDNSAKRTDFTKSSRVYKNIGTTAQVKFELQQDDFLQEEMIDLGYNAVAAFDDINNDGKADLVIANGGLLNDETLSASLTYFQNTGSENNPAFTLQSRDFLNLSSFGMTDIFPGFADLNGDGKADLYFRGTSEDGTTSLFYVLRENGNYPESPVPAVVPIPVVKGDKPVFGHLNSDAFADLLVFRSSGRLEYYGHQAIQGAVGFNLLEENFAGFTDIFENRNLTPAISDIDNNGLNELVISNRKGQLFVIDNFFSHQSGLEGAKIISVKNDKTNATYHKSFGFESNVAFAPLFRGELPTMVVGSRQGGVYLLRNKSGSLNPGEDSFVLNCSPVPSDGILNVEVNEAAQITLYNPLGEIVWGERQQSAGTKYQYNTSDLAAGVYIVRAISHSGKRKARKIIVL